MTAIRYSPPNLRDDGDRTADVSYVVLQYEIGGIEQPIASHDHLKSCEEHVARLTNDAAGRLDRTQKFYSWVAVERYRG